MAMTRAAVDGRAGPLLILAVAVVLATSVVLANEALRRSLPWHAKRLSRSKRRAVLVAGDAILARPRQATVPAFIVAMATTVVIALYRPARGVVGALGTPAPAASRGPTRTSRR